MGKLNPRKEAWLKRRKRVRSRVLGTSERPRLNIFRSARHMYAQIIDDSIGSTLVAASTLSPEIRPKLGELKGKIEPAQEVGRLIAEKAKEKGIGQVVFDRNGFLYHGRIKAVADGARKGGLKF